MMNHWGQIVHFNGNSLNCVINCIENNAKDEQYEVVFLSDNHIFHEKTTALKGQKKLNDCECIIKLENPWQAK